MAVAAVALFCILATLSHALQVATDSGPNQMRPCRRKADVTIPQGLVAGPPAEKSVQCNWGGVNSYFLYALPEAQQDAILRSLQKYGLKVVRIFIDTVSKDHKDSGSFFVPHLEPDHMGQCDTTVLELINKLMVKVQLYGIKLAIALHDRYSLGCYSCDGYQKDLQLNCIAPKCSRLNDATEFYKSNVAIEFFDKRLRMILNYKNPLLGKRWGELKDVVAMYEIQNEAQGLDSSWVEGWHCARANVIRSSISSEILIGTGGGRTFASSSRLEHFYCPDIDVVTLHDYDSTSWTQMYGGILAARDLGLTYGKKVVHEEFGREHKLARPDYFYAVISAAVDLGVPFMPWQYVIPANNRDDDYEFDERQAAWPVLVFGVLQANATPAAFTWSNLELCTVA